MLRGETLSWWNVTKYALGLTIMAMLIRKMFKGKIINKYCNKKAHDEIEDKFRALQKYNMFVTHSLDMFMEKL